MKMNVLRPLLSFAVLAGVILLYQPSLAQLAPSSKTPVSAAQRQAARTDFLAGRENLKAGQFEQALMHFKRADDVMGVPTTRLGVADALAGMGRLVEARRVARSIEKIPPTPKRSLVFQAARERADKLIESLSVRLPTLIIVWPADSPTDFTLMLNEKLVNRPNVAKTADTGLKRMILRVDPDEHTLRANASGYTPFSATFEMAEGGVRTIKVQLTPLPTNDTGSDTDGGTPAAAADGPSWAVGPVTWTGLGVTGAGLLMGAVAGALTLGDASDLDRRPVVSQDELDNAYTTSYVSTAGFALAGAGAAAGLLGLLVVDPSLQVNDSEVAITPVIGPGWMKVQGTF